MFSPESFGDLTIDVVLQALEKGQQLRRQDAHLNELGMATLTSCFVNANRDPKKGKAAKPSDFFYFAGGDSLDPAIASSYFSLIPDKLMPPWAVHAAPLELLKQSKVEGVPPRKRRALIGKGVALFAPEVGEKEVFTDFAVFSNADWGWCTVEDVDTEETFEVFVIPSDHEQQYCRDLILERR